MLANMQKWVRQQLFTARAAGPCTKLVMRHIVLGGKLGSPVTTREVEEPDRNDSGVEALASELFLIAAADAQGLGGVQQYCLQAFHGDSDNQSARFTFRMDGEPEDGESDGMLSEPASLKGALAQQMRHNEAIMKTSLAAVQGIIATQARTIESQNQRLSAMEQERIESLDTVVSLVTDSHQRELETRKAEHREKMIEGMVNRLGPLIGIVANKVSGGKLLPPPVKDGVAAVFGSLMEDPDRLGKIMQLLNPEERGLLQDIIGLGKPEAPAEEPSN